jgi:hypothetical protein
VDQSGAGRSAFFLIEFLRECSCQTKEIRLANNLHITYDLHQPGQNYPTVIAKIKTLGNWAKITESCWYVQSNYSASQAAHLVWSVMDANDKLYVVDAKNNVAAWHNLDPVASEAIKARWQ